MEQKNSKIFNKQIMQAVSVFCNANNIENVDDFMLKCFKQGFDIEKYGFLGKTGGEQEKWVEKEVIVEKRVEIPVEVIKEVVKYVETPVEIIKEVEVIKYVDREVIKEVPVEIIKEKVLNVIKEVPVEKVVIKEVVKEVPVEKVITKTEYISDDTKTNELLLKIQQLEDERREFSTKTGELTKEVEKFSTITQEMENIFQNKMSKKDEEIDELRHSLDELLAKPPVEKIIEVEKIVEKPNDKAKLLETTLQNLRKELTLKNETIKELENKNKQLESINIDRGAVYMKGSNLTQNL